LIERIFSFENNVKAQRFFAPIIDNLNILQVQGLRINGDQINFSFSTMTADNLAAHTIGGFQSCFSTGHFCRRCQITYADRLLPFSPTTIRERTSIEHDNFVQQVMADPHKSSLMGVIEQSVLHNLMGFHPTMSLPADCMHDFLEGVCPLVVMALLKQASSIRLLTYSKKWLHPMWEKNAKIRLTSIF
jgi:hypothetical protein